MATKKSFEGARRPAPKFNFMPKQQPAAAGGGFAAPVPAATDSNASDDDEVMEVVEVIAERDLRKSFGNAGGGGGGPQSQLSRLHAEAAEQNILSTAFETPTTYNPLQKRQIKINLGTVPAPSHTLPPSLAGVGGGRPLLPNPAELALGQGYALGGPPSLPLPAHTMSGTMPGILSMGRPRTPPTPTPHDFDNVTPPPEPSPTPPTPPLASSVPSLNYLPDLSRPPPGFDQLMEQHQQRHKQLRAAALVIGTPTQPPAFMAATSTLLRLPVPPQAPRGPLLGERPVSEQTRRSLPLPSLLPSLPRLPPPSSPSSAIPLVSSGRRVLLDQPPLALGAESEEEEDTEVRQAEQFFDELESWLAQITSYESEMNRYFQTLAMQLHEHCSSVPEVQQTEEGKREHETEYKKLYDEYGKFMQYMHNMREHYAEKKKDLEERRQSALDRRVRRQVERWALRENQLAAHTLPTAKAPDTAVTAQVALAPASLLVEAYAVSASSSSTSASIVSAATAAGAAAAAAVSALGRMDLSDPNSWNKFAANLPPNADANAYYRIYYTQMAANFKRLLGTVPPKEAERLQADALGGGGDSGGELDGGIDEGLTLQGLTRNQRKKLRNRAKALQDAKAAKRRHKLLLAAPKGAAASAIGGTPEAAEPGAPKPPTPPSGYMDPAGDPRLIMQDYFERFANGEWNFATWSQYITVMQRHNQAWYDIFIAKSRNHGINWNDMYRYYTGGRSADQIDSAATGLNLQELAAQPPPPPPPPPPLPPPEPLFDDNDENLMENADLVELDALGENGDTAAACGSKREACGDRDRGDMNDEDGTDVEEEDWTFCQLCNQEFRSERGYLAHLRGVTHMKHALDRAAAKKPHMFKEEKARQADAAKAEESAQQTHTVWMAAQLGAIQRTGLGGTFLCVMCDATCTSQKALDFHLNGERHRKGVAERVKAEKAAAAAEELQKRRKLEELTTATVAASVAAAPPPPPPAASTSSDAAQLKPKAAAFAAARRGDKAALRAQTLLNNCLDPLLGLQYLTEYQRENPMLECRYFCELCNINFLVGDLVGHLNGMQHRKQFMKCNYPDLFAILSQDKSPRQVKVRRYETYAKRIENCEGRKKMNLKVEVPPADAFGDPMRGGVGASSWASGGTASSVKYTLKSKRRRRGLEEGEINEDGEQSGGPGDSEPEEGEALDNAGPPTAKSGVEFVDAVLVDRGLPAATSTEDETTRVAFIRRLREQRLLAAPEATIQALESFNKEADWAIRRRMRAAGLCEDDTNVIRFGAASQPQQHMTSLVEQIRAMTGINLGIARTHSEAFQIPSIQGLRLDIDRIKDTPDPAEQMRNLVTQIQEFMCQKATGYASQQPLSTGLGAAMPPLFQTPAIPPRLGLLSSGSSLLLPPPPALPTNSEAPSPDLTASAKIKRKGNEENRKKKDRKDRKDRKDKEEKEKQQQKLIGAIHLPGQDTIIHVTKQKKAKKNRHDAREKEAREKEREREKREDEKQRQKAKVKERKRKEKEKEREREAKRKRRVAPATLPPPAAVAASAAAGSSAFLSDLAGSAVFDAYSAFVGGQVKKSAAAPTALSSKSEGAHRVRMFGGGDAASSLSDSSDDDDYKSDARLASMARHSLRGATAASSIPSQPSLLGLGSLPHPPLLLRQCLL